MISGPSNTPTRSAVAVSTALAALLASTHDAAAQGCVAVRGGGLCSLNHAHQGDHAMVDGDWEVSLSYRWLHSFRHFASDRETRNAAGLTRVEAGTEVINDSHFFDVGVSYTFSPRYSASLVLPFVYSDRSSLYEHSAGGRHHTQAGGLGDLRLSGYAWVIDPATAPKGNIQFGLGMKFPTGDYKATDTYQTARGPEVHYVDQSIQPGDGGWGFSTEMFGYQRIADRLSAYVQGFYLFNPESENGVSSRTSNFRGKTYQALLNGAAAGNATAIARLDRAESLGYANYKSLEDNMSIADQYMVRGGLSYLLWPKYSTILSLGGRVEGVPSEDLLGTSDGFRRPGYTVSIEPGISASYSRYTLAVTAPVALYRNRIASEPDKRWGEITQLGTVPGDAAFADYVITAAFSFRF
ncbi:MAG: hypothetical protein KF833_15965 [Verrucomicrobiae bacterium]|nr:hypothetical protein [Verrucomicrobiae bacterium]